jgi:ABC-type antimicrobial peptide transport system ATPase subunit
MRLFVEGRVCALDQAQFVLIVTDAKFTVSWALEARFDAQQFSVPPLCRLQIGCPITDRCESSQWLCIAHSISPFSSVKAI